MVYDITKFVILALFKTIYSFYLKGKFILPKRFFNLRWASSLNRLSPILSFFKFIFYTYSTLLKLETLGIVFKNGLELLKVC